MILDIYTDARSENIPNTKLKRNKELKQIGLQISSIFVDENDNEYSFVEVTSVDELKKKWPEFDNIDFKSDSTCAEMYSIYKSLTEIVWLDFFVKRVNIYTDSEQAYKFINKVSKDPNGDVGFRPLTPKNKLISKIYYDILEKIESLRKYNIIVDVRWIKGHDACYFNLKADYLCKNTGSNPFTTFTT